MYRITRVDFEKNPLIRFTVKAKKEGEQDREISLKDYY